mgnify:CR=1 FL=1
MKLPKPFESPKLPKCLKRSKIHKDIIHLTLVILVLPVGGIIVSAIESLLGISYEDISQSAEYMHKLAIMILGALVAKLLFYDVHRQS